MLDLNNPELEFAIEIVRRAAGLVKLIQSQLVTEAISKEDRSPVTIADYSAQALAAHDLQTTFPNDPRMDSSDPI